jgi:hypothetical protein
MRGTGVRWPVRTSTRLSSIRCGGFGQIAAGVDRFVRQPLGVSLDLRPGLEPNAAPFDREVTRQQPHCSRGTMALDLDVDRRPTMTPPFLEKWVDCNALSRFLQGSILQPFAARIVGDRASRWHSIVVTIAGVS